MNSLSRESVQKHHKKIFSLNTNSLSNVKTTKDHPLYPYHSCKMFVFFIYGTDVRRQKMNDSFNRLIQMQSKWKQLFWILAAFALCFLRRKLRIRRDGLISAFIDMSVAFTGGGTLCIVHKHERRFFAIVFVGVFFMNAIWFEKCLYPAFLIRYESIDSFAELAKINPPFFSSSLLEAHNKHIIYMLRYILINAFMFYQ